MKQQEAVLPRPIQLGFLWILLYLHLVLMQEKIS